jgi:ubiquinone/menaquinone biosynthesis C-methylase UbiE
MQKDTPKAGYLHGYSPEEQERLYAQARFLESSLYDTLDFSSFHQMLEVGMGVGAQTEIILRRFPALKVYGVDASPEQLARAKTHLKDAVAAGRVDIREADALHLPYSEDFFDGAFCCWFLEHVPEPVGILKEIRRVLKPGGTIFCNEVLNATFFLHPYSPATQQYWLSFNDHQWAIKGDPFVGGKLGNILLAAGYQNVSTAVKSFHYDNRAPKQRAQMIEYWTRMLLSGTPSLLAAKRITPEIVEEMKAELGRLKSDPDAVFFYACIQARGQVF